MAMINITANISSSVKPERGVDRLGRIRAPP
jgi:hypothetical protein